MSISGLDSSIYVSIATRITITIEATDGSTNTLTPRTLGLSDEVLHLYRGSESVDSVATGRALSKSIECPSSEHGIMSLRFSFGERDRARLRELTATGGYQIRLSYITDIVRGVPSWAVDLGPAGRPPRGLLCRPTQRGPDFVGGFGGVGAFSGALAELPQFTFPICIGGAGGLFVGDFLFPSRPGINPDCLADGPGCWEYFLVQWPVGYQGLDVLIRSPSPLTFELFDEQRKLITRSQVMSPNNQSSAAVQRLRLPPLAEGLYIMRIEGSPASYQLEFKPPEFIPK